MKSPFFFGRVVQNIELVDRKDELQEVVNALQQEGRLFLIGPRRFGKTSILSTAAVQARKAGALVIQVNAEEFVTLQALAAEIIKQTGEQLRSTLAKSVARVKQVFGSLNPQVTYNPLTDAWSVGITAKSSESETAYLTDALNSLDTLAEKADRPVALIIDEFQQVVARDGIEAERQLRAVIQRHRNVGYVFAGSAMTMLMAMTGEHSRPFYRLGSRRFLGPVPRQDFRVYLKTGLSQVGSSVDDSAIEAILDYAEDVPYSIQRLADLVWQSAAVASNPPVIDSVYVEHKLTDHLSVESPQYGTLIEQLTPAQLRVLVAVANEPAKSLTSSKTARKYDVAVSTLKRALEALMSRGIIRRVYDGDPKKRWVFEDPFFGCWVRRRLRI